MTRLDESSDGARIVALPKRLSASAIERYQRCGKAYYLTDVRREGGGAKTAQMVAGNAIHETMERFYTLPSDHRWPEHLFQTLRLVWPRYAAQFANERESTRFGQDAMDLLAIYASRFDLDERPLHTEHTIRALLPGGREISGRIDRIDISANASLDLIDYKTGSRLLTAPQLARDLAARTYAFLASGMYDLPVERVRWIYLRAGIEVVWEPTSAEVVATKDCLVRAVRRIEADRRFVANEDWHCRTCPHQKTCDGLDGIRPAPYPETKETT